MALMYDFVGKKPRVQVPGEYPVRRPLPGYHFVTSAFAGRLALGRLRHRTRETGERTDTRRGFYPYALSLPEYAVLTLPVIALVASLLRAFP